MIAAITAASLLASANAVSIHYDQFSGLTVDVSGARLVSGSSFQYYEPGWKSGIYSSRWQPKSVTSTPDGITVRFQGKGGDVLGTIKYTLVGNELTARYEFGWNGPREVRIENCFGLMWASAFKDATAESTGLRRSQFSLVPMQDDSVLTRALAIDTKSIVFDAPFGLLAVSSELPFIVFDGRNYPQEWARGRPVHWAGVQEHAIKAGSRIAYTVKWSFSQLLDRPPSTQTMSGLAAKMERAQQAQEPLPVLPTPERLDLKEGFVRTSGRFVFDTVPRELHIRSEALLNSLVASRWETTEAPPTRVSVHVGNGSEDSYSMWASSGDIHIEASRESGLTHAVTRLAQLVRSDGDGLVVPNFAIPYDSPRIDWRGVHMFVGPHALEFQTRLMDRLLVPLRFDHVVLQCERTVWECLPGIKTASTMPREDLVRLFANYRERGIEPIPLVESLGHMEWLFANGQNLDIAVNPAQPFTLDVRKQRAREVIESLWSEVISLLGPKTVHFGLDEIDSRGQPADPTLSTRLWNIQLPALIGMAKRYGVQPMLWGDMMVAPAEANDSAHAPDVATASVRRAAVPKGTMVGDWHYSNEPNPKKYRSLALWRPLGMIPIAAGWSRPNNIAGLTQAAIANKAGFLQTTWAGYESSETNMVREIDQLAAYVLAADYAWGRQPLAPEKLPYEEAEVARRMLFDARQPARPIDGVSLLATDGPEFKVGQYRFRGGTLFSLRSNVSVKSASAPTGMKVTVGRAAKRIAIAVDCFAWMEFGAPVASIVVLLADGTSIERSLRYGLELRAADDPNPTATARSSAKSAFVIEISDTPTLIKSIEFQRSDAAAGLRVHGITII